MREWEKSSVPLKLTKKETLLEEVNLCVCMIRNQDNVSLSNFGRLRLEEKLLSFQHFNEILHYEHSGEAEHSMTCCYA